MEIYGKWGDIKKIIYLTRKSVLFIYQKDSRHFKSH